MEKGTARKLTLSAVVAALYVALTFLGSLMGIAYGPVQLRPAEALTLLPFLCPSTAWGLFAGCLMANLLSPYGPVDVIVGSLATLLAALLTGRARRRVGALWPPVVCNGVLVGSAIAWVETGFTAAFPAAALANGLTVALGETAAVVLLGLPLLRGLERAGLGSD